MNNQAKGAIDLLLAESFKELAKKKPIEKITIKEITSSAGVIRPTFYNHFQDKYELLEWIVREELMMPMLKIMGEGRYHDGVVYVLDKIHEEKAFYQRAVTLEGQNSFADTLQGTISRIIEQFIDEKKLREIIGYSWVTPKVAADAYAQFIGYMIIDWIKNNMHVPKEELVGAVVFLLQHSTAELLLSSWKQPKELEILANAKNAPGRICSE